MGVPKFFRWCAERYPSVITPFKDSPPPVDNLYLDVNGIIHNCTHPNDVDATRRSPTEKEMIEAMFAYLEKLFNAIKPRKHFLLAVDGVAPRAKMNQQRQRRYRAGYEMMVARSEALAMGEDVPDEKDVFDSNCITPGTPFMVRVSKEFQYFIEMKMAVDPAWRTCKVIFSGHDCPGEGEHKIVDFVRRRKMLPGYDPNETHCMYGLDADLVMLALATHEPHFVLLREVVTFGPGSRKERERQEEDEAKGLVKDKAYRKADEFVLLHINVFRDYLKMEVASMLQREGKNSDFNLERVIDDFVFMCFFVGNDFLPTLPTVGINDGSMTVMLNLYVKNLLSKGLYITHTGKVDWRQAEVWLTSLGLLEYETLRKRQKDEEEYIQRRARFDPEAAAAPAPLPITSIVEFKQKYYTDKHGFQGGWDPNSADMRKLKRHFVEGLMWVLQYYYHGVPSWKWFYPHYYAPMASDMVNLASIAEEVNFQLGKPFLPHQQLLAVLPPMSYLSMPKAYWPLLRSPSSPLVKYFPEHIEIDREGARAPWEGIVLIPFIEERVLLAAYDSVQSNVDPADNANNRNGNPLCFTYDSTMNPFDLVSDMFETVPNIKVRSETFPFPESPAFVPELCKGVCIEGSELEGFSTLQSKRLLMRPSFESGAVSVFGRPTQKDSLIINLEDFFKAASASDVVTLVGKEVLVGFPHYKRARVSVIRDAQTSLTAVYSKEGTFSGVETRANNRDETLSFLKEAETHAKYMKSQLGIAVEALRILIEVHRFNGMEVTRKGRIVRRFSSTLTCYPIQLLSTLDSIVMVEDSRYVERDRPSEEMSSGMLCTYLGPPPRNKKGNTDVYGSCGSVVSVDQSDRDGKTSNQFTIRVTVFTEPLRLPASLTQFASQQNWISLPQLGSRMGLSPRTISILCSSLTTSAQFGSRELGLCLKFTGRCLARVGYSKLVQHSMNPWYMGNKDIFARMERDTEDIGHHLEKTEKGDYVGNVSVNRSGSGTWYFSKDARELLNKYITAFRPLVDYLESGSVNTQSIEPQQFLRGPWHDRDADDVVTEIETFLQESGIFEVPMITATEETFTQHQLEELEEAHIAQMNRPRKVVSLKSVSKNQLFFPITHSSRGHIVPLPLPRDQTFRLGSRVVNCRPTGTTPFGLQGTIVRLLASGREAEVVYDSAFPGGTRLDGRLKMNMGGMAKLSSLLVLRVQEETPPSSASPSPTGVSSAVPVSSSIPSSPPTGSSKLDDLQQLLHANGINVAPKLKTPAAPDGSSSVPAPQPASNPSLVPLPRSAGQGAEPPKRTTPTSATAHLASAGTGTSQVRAGTSSFNLTASPGSGINIKDLASRLPASPASLQMSAAAKLTPATATPVAVVPAAAPAATAATATPSVSTPAQAEAASKSSAVSIPAPKSVQLSRKEDAPRATAPGSSPTHKAGHSDHYIIPDDFMSGRINLSYKNCGSVFRTWVNTFTSDAIKKALEEMDLEAEKSGTATS